MAFDPRPNILFLMTDQQRSDCLGIAGHPVLQTPTLDEIAYQGVRFSSAYSACPVCVAARRTLMSGQRPATHGVVSNYCTLLHGPTLPGELQKTGYQTFLSGKLHLWPLRRNYGFETMRLSDGPGFHEEFEHNSDYLRFMQQQGFGHVRPQHAHGCTGNSWVTRPWHLDERFHVANWVTDQALEFLETRDQTRPFFLNVSYFHPHSPVNPPQCYYDRYMQMDLPEPCVGEWARVFDKPMRGLGTSPFRVYLEPQLMRQFRAAYYGAINHINDQIQRIVDILPGNTIVVFCSDHGDMLGDHQQMHKSVPYEGSAHVPLFMRFPDTLGLPQQQIVDAPVELMDIMPTLLDAVGVPIPATVEGRSVLPLIRREGNWRDFIHGECHGIPGSNSGMQYLTNGKRKYVWWPGLGKEEYFNLEDDPCERFELSNEPGYSEEISHLRAMLIEALKERPEGFVAAGRLARLDGATAPFLPGFEQDTSVIRPW